MSFAEKRRHPRLAIYSAALAITGGEGYLSDVKDLSQGGACLGRPKNWPGQAADTCRKPTLRLGQKGVDNEIICNRPFG